MSQKLGGIADKSGMGSLAKKVNWSALCLLPLAALASTRATFAADSAFDLMESCRSFVAPNPLADGRDALIAALKNKFQVEIKKDDPALFNEDFLLYLYTYFGTTKPEGAPFHLFATTEDSPQRVKLKKSDDGRATELYFSKTAGRDLETAKLREARDVLAKHPEILSQSDVIKITIDYSNTLFDQMNRELLSHARVKKIIEEKYRLQVSPKEELGPYQDFKVEELNTILKQLLDLPETILKNMKLKSLVRMKPGLGIPGGGIETAADYNPATQQIRVCDVAFSQSSDSLGEGTFLHEIGHAVWYAMPPGMRKAYCETSWAIFDDTGSKEKCTAKPGVSDFVSEYATTSCAEDFAEHYSAYVHRSERLATKAPAKKAWLHHNIFPNITYFSTAHAKAKLEVDSACPDTKAPNFAMGTAGDNISYVCNALDAGRAELIVEVKNVEDDVSGVKEIYINFDGPSWESCTVILGKQHCVDPTTGNYRIREVLDLNNFPRGDYIPKIALGDRAGNDRWVSNTGMKSIFIPGTKYGESSTPEKPMRPQGLDAPDFEERMNFAADPEEAGSYWVELPLTAEDLRRAKVGSLWFGTTPPTFSFAWDFDPKKVTFSADGKIRFKAKLGTLPSGRYRVDRLSLEVLNEKGDEYEHFSRDFTPSRASNQFEHVGPSYGSPEVDLGSLSFTAKDGKNSEGGEVTLAVSFKASGFAAGAEHMWVDIRTPDGKELTLYGTVKKMAETQTISVQVPLKPNHAKGAYIIQDIHYQVGLPKVPGLYVTGFGRKTVKLLERGIRKTIEIKVTPKAPGRAVLVPPK